MSERDINAGNIGLDFDSILSQKKKGSLSYALNAIVEGFDGDMVTYQNEQGNELCVTFPAGYKVNGKLPVPEFNLVVFWLVNPETGDSEIGTLNVEECIYTTTANSKCLNLSVNFPILKAEFRKVNNSLQVFWTDAYNNRRYLDFGRLPYKTIPDPNGCGEITTTDIDCNKMNVQPNFSIPTTKAIAADNDGELIEGTYQVTVQYANAAGVGLTSFYNPSNPVSIFDPLKVSQSFNLITSRSVKFEIDNIDTTGVYEYVNVAVIETVNNIETPYLVNTYKIEESSLTVIYTGANKTQIRVTSQDLFEKFPIYNKANDLTAVQDVLVWAGLTTDDRTSFQKIANQIQLKWQAWKLSRKNNDTYAKPLNTANVKSYMGDEVYALEFVPILDDGQELDAFHIPSRHATPYDLEVITNDDVIADDATPCDPVTGGLPRWKVYNTASITGNDAPECGEIPGGGAGVPDTSEIQATISTSCSDSGCTEQGEISLTITLSRVLTEPYTLKIGHVVHYPATNQNQVQGYSFFDQGGIDPYSYYADPSIPFLVTIPAGVSSISIPELIYMEGLAGDPNATWICHSCQFPTTDIYVMAESASNTRMTFTTPQNVRIHNIYPEGQIIGGPSSTPPTTVDCDCYSGPWVHGEFSYWESTERYPCNPEIWGDLSGMPIRHHKFPDSAVIHIHDKEGNIYPKGILIDIDQVRDLIKNSNLPQTLKDKIAGFKIVRGNRAANKSITGKGIINNVGIYKRDSQTYFYPNYPFNDLREDPFLATEQISDDTGNASDFRLKGFDTDDSKRRFTFHSPDTSFYQPSLGDQLKLETVEFGKSQGHFPLVQKHAGYKLLSTGAYATALGVAVIIGGLSGTYGLSTNVFNGTAAFTAYQVIVDVIDKLVPRKNYAYQFNSVGNYTDYKVVPNAGKKIRFADIAAYLIPGMTSLGDVNVINNFQRESSVYVRTTKILPVPQDFGAPEDQSRYILSDVGKCDSSYDVVEKDISSFYASLKRSIPNQYGPIYSYEVVDTGFYQPISATSNTSYGTATIFGGDTFIGKFAYKSKIPFFIDNRVGFNDDADVFYNELNNVAFPIFWMSTDAKSTGGGLLGGIKQFFGVKTNNFDCRGDKFFYQNGKFYLFAYGIPYFFCETEVNVDYRQAYDDKVGDFYPHVGTGIPDDWLQEKNVTIQQDNSYIYNKTFSKQNKEDNFTHLPEDYLLNLRSDLTNTIIFSEKQETFVNSRTNNWLIYRPVSKMDLPLNYGKLIAVDAIENRQMLARFEKKSLLYNVLLTAPTSAADVYLGQSIFSQQVPPLDFAETDLGYNGTQHKFLLRTEFGAVSVDSERGQVFILSGTKDEDISSAKYHMTKFFTTKLDFQIKKAFPGINIDNHFNGIGLHGVYDNKYNRIIITKLDYQPIISGITYQDGKFSFGGSEISLQDVRYFCNKSFTISFDIDNLAWISFHSYLPNFYVGGSNFFYSGVNGPSSTLWRHNTTFTLFNNFYGVTVPYTIEYPYSYKDEDEILQSVSDYTKVNRQLDEVRFVQTSDIYFSKSIIYNDEQASGILSLTAKQRNNLAAYSQYPKYHAQSKEILFTRSGSFYNYNTIYDIVKDITQPIFLPSCASLNEDKVLNTSNLDYTNRSFKKYPIRGKDCRIRHILDDRSDVRLISQFVITETQKSYK